MQGAINRKVIQLHPTRRCNLECRHCYSKSGPRQREELDLDIALRFLKFAKTKGYEVLSVSGGEPLAYSKLPVLLKKACAMGYRCNLVTNGTLARNEILSEIRNYVDLIAVSLDGPREAHNLMRGSATAFDRMLNGLKSLRKSGIPFGLLFTLTRSNLAQLEWLFDFAVSQRAKLIQVHPLEQCGNALKNCSKESLDSFFMSEAYLALSLLRRRYVDEIALQIDLFNRYIVSNHPAMIYAGEAKEATLPNPLVVKPNGQVLPISYGFAERFEVMDLNRNRWEEEWDTFVSSKCGELKRLANEIMDTVVANLDYPYFNFYEVFERESHAFKILV